MRILDAIRLGGARVQKIRLTPLAPDHVGELVADALRCEHARAVGLTALVHEKTGGNPFFLIQFLYTLSEEGLLWFEHAAYMLVPQELLCEAHLRIGRLLAAHTPPDKRREAIFEIVTQLNRGAALMATRDEREQLAAYNLIAARRAKASTAYASALTYLIAGAALLPENPWECRYELTFALELHRAECEFLTGALAEAETRLAELAGRAASLTDLAIVTRLQVNLFMPLGRSDRAVAVGLDYLRRVGIA
jgi:predicted ATPase